VICKLVKVLIFHWYFELKFHEEQKESGLVVVSIIHAGEELRGDKVGLC
jgi:hypothetical protein